MEKWNCPHCQEELLGAANRCWKCGQRVKRPKPVEVLVAEVLPEPALTSAEPLRLTPDEVSQAVAKEPPRRGSPFAFEAAEVPGLRKPFYGDGPYRRVVEKKSDDAPLIPNYRSDQVPMVSAALGIAVGGISVILSFITIFACISALVGLGLSLFGLTAKHRGIAVPGIALSSLALAICFFWLLLGLLFAYLQGVAGQGQPPVLY